MVCEAGGVGNDRQVIDGRLASASRKGNLAQPCDVATNAHVIPCAVRDQMTM
jgi:hypothetical protein